MIISREVHGSFKAGDAFMDNPNPCGLAKRFCCTDGTMVPVDEADEAEDESSSGSSGSSGTVPVSSR